MGTDLDEIYIEPCICGNGMVTILFCTPDHVYPTSLQWFQTIVSCEKCKSELEVIEQENKFVFVKKEDFEIKEQLKSD